MEVVRPRVGVVVPGGLLHAGKDYAGSTILGLLLGPDEPVAVFGIGIFARGLKPRVLVGSMVDDEIDEHAHAALTAAVRELDEVAQRAITRIDAIVVGDVVAVVEHGRGLE